jgi:hypothetical protein
MVCQFAFSIWMRLKFAHATENLEEKYCSDGASFDGNEARFRTFAI